jgi:hypothetical protein
VPASYRVLDAEQIIKTQRLLQGRIGRRFPGSGLSGVAADLLAVAEESAVRAKDIRRPNLLLRAAVGLLLLAASAFVVAVAASVRIRADLGEALNLVQFADAALGALVFIGLGVLFLVSLEIRLKRRRALAALHELRALAHVVDMHQVAKDPEGLLRRGPTLTPPPPQTTTTLFELSRYLHYCSELLVIVSKIAALYVQDFPDRDAVSAVDQVERLCSGLSQKIWQKIMVLEEIIEESASSQPAGRSETPAAEVRATGDGAG